jgi:hypothetical protein
MRPWRRGETDTFARVGRPEVTFEIASHAVPEGMSQEAFLAAHLRELTDAELDQSCGLQAGLLLGPYIGGASPRWVQLPRQAEPTWARRGCHRTEAVVFRDNAALVISLRGAGLRLDLFEEMFTAIDFDGRVESAP